MAKPDVCRALQGDLSNPGAIKSGECLEDLVLQTVRRAFAAGDRTGVVDALREWLVLRKEPHSMLAIAAVREERIGELILDVEALRSDVMLGRAFKKYYLPAIDRAIAAIRGPES